MQRILIRLHKILKANSNQYERQFTEHLLKIYLHVDANESPNIVQRWTCKVLIMKDPIQRKGSGKLLHDNDKAFPVRVASKISQTPLQCTFITRVILYIYGLVKSLTSLDHHSDVGRPFTHRHLFFIQQKLHNLFDERGCKGMCE